MSTVPYTQFLVEITPYVSGVPEFVATNAVRNACVEFCTKTWWWQVDAASFTTVIGTSSYAPTGLTTDQKFVGITEAWYNNILLIPKSAEELSRLYRGLDWRSVQGDPRYITREVFTNIILVPQPQAVGTVTWRVALAPTRASTTVDSSLFEEHLERIARGAKARLYATAGQPYYDPKASEFYSALFKKDIAEVRIQVNKGLGRTSTQAEYMWT